MVWITAETLINIYLTFMNNPYFVLGHKNLSECCKGAWLIANFQIQHPEVMLKKSLFGFYLDLLIKKLMQNMFFHNIKI